MVKNLCSTNLCQPLAGLWFYPVLKFLGGRVPPSRVSVPHRDLASPHRILAPPHEKTFRQKSGR